MREWKELLLPVSVAELHRPGSGDSPAARWIPLSFFEEIFDFHARNTDHFTPIQVKPFVIK